jgi:hypothetical protein
MIKTRLTRRTGWAALAFAVYVTAIVASNFLIAHVGIPAGPGTHLSPVGFGLMAPSGVWAAAVSFPARDVTQRLAGRWLGFAAIFAGAGLSFATSSHAVAAASGFTYLCSESLDFAVFTRLQKGARALSTRWFVTAVVASGCVAAVADSWIFLHARWIPFLHAAALPAGAAAVGGLILGKAWVQVAAGPASWLLRRTGPLALPADAAPEVVPA